MQSGSGVPGSPGDPVLIWGAGAMGGAIGATLHRAGHEVVLVDADVAHVEAIRSDGLRITGPVAQFTARPPAFTPEELAGDGGGRFGTVFLCVKAHHTEAALEGLVPHLTRDGCVVSVQNGLNERVIAARLGSQRTVGCFVNFGADVMEPGMVMWGNRGAVVVGELDGALDGRRILNLHRLLQEFDADAVLTGNIWGYLWGKLAYGALLFATALSDGSIADVLAAQDHRETLTALAREAMAVARAQGVTPEPFDGFDPRSFGPEADDGDARRSLDDLVRFNRGSAKTHSGVWRDLAVRKRKTEVDAQIAPIAHLGDEVGIPTPLTRRLVELIHDVEEGRRSQSWETLEALGA